ncbi:hypothetical protein SAMN05192559_106159 [Halobacillus karajensis]|uniref:Uncharacterized protein n=1 Tax=Halobacillus karajensis TaxID=195088 RepID=A0A024P6Y2_9BACI|nr:hypothetical protein BN982_03420 [Halobacillus karajensis]CDQ24879.1 hypothetical protein BN983_03178 [Halobacillus karajensis]CDQ28761.1 hypothetical protein BN981_03076 [Halobacillus karajensis]SEH96823.1 hypothetical protein SAMN05192559_106159 [Halobacillus karajensis]
MIGKTLPDRERFSYGEFSFLLIRLGRYAVASIIQGNAPAKGVYRI